MQLRHALMTGAGKVITFFQQLDTDGDGAVTKAEFRRALPLLGYDASDTGAIDDLFDELDLDLSGELRYEELKELLTMDRLAERGLELAAALQDGALGEIETTAKNRHSLRHGDVTERRGEQRQASVDAMRETLWQSAGKVTDVFRSLDRDTDGSVTRDEFARGLAQLGYATDDPELLGELFDELDSSGDGVIAYDELERLLRPRAELAENLRAGALGEIEVHARNRLELRPGGINLLEQKELQREQEAAEAIAAEREERAREAAARDEAATRMQTIQRGRLARQSTSRGGEGSGTSPASPTERGEDATGGWLHVACEVGADARARLHLRWHVEAARPQSADGAPLWRGVAVECTVLPESERPSVSLGLVIL